MQIIPKETNIKPLILGIDWVLQQQIALHLSQGSIVIHNVPVPVLCKCEIETPNRFVQTPHEIRIPAFTKQVVEISVVGLDQENIIRPTSFNVFTSENEYSGKQAFIRMPESIVSVNQDRVPLLIFNYSDEEYCIDEGIQVGTLSPLSDDSSEIYEVCTEVNLGPINMIKDQPDDEYPFLPDLPLQSSNNKQPQADLPSSTNFPYFVRNFLQNTGIRFLP